MASSRQHFFDTRGQWQQQCETNKSTDPHECPICRKRLPTRCHAARHILRIHSGNSDETPTTLQAVVYYLTEHDKIRTLLLRTHTVTTALEEEDRSIGLANTADSHVTSEAPQATVAARMMGKEEDSSTRNSGTTQDSTMNLAEYWQHQLSSWRPDMPHQCPCCLGVFSTRGNAVRHIVRLHIGDRAGFTNQKVTAFLRERRSPASNLVGRLTERGALRIRVAMLRQVFSHPYTIIDTIRNEGTQAFDERRDRILKIEAALRDDALHTDERKHSSLVAATKLTRWKTS